MFKIDDKKVLPQKFYLQPTILVAKQLLGKYLVRRINDAYLVGKVVETEAYLGSEDEAAHSFVGQTKRTKVLFGEAGYTYVHSIHRFHCLDITTEEYGIPTSILIRALEPIEGVELMKELRQIQDETNLTNGPGKLCHALGINKSHNEIDVTSFNSEIFLIDNSLQHSDSEDIVETSRIGISKAKDLPLRFYIESSTYISRR